MLSQVSQAKTIHKERSLYRNILVTQVGDRRCLVFDVNLGHRNQSCMNMRKPDELVFHYVRMTFAGLLLNAEPENILVIGLGGGSIPTTLSQLLPDATIDVVEIDRAVVKVAKAFFHFEESAKLAVDVSDARVFIKRAGLRGVKYDYIVLDAFNGDYIPEHLMTEEFLREVKAILSPNSVLIANTFSTSKLYDHESVTYQKVFGQFFNFKLPGSGNRVILSRLQPLPDKNKLMAVAQQLDHRLDDYGIDILEYPPRLSSRVDWDQTKRPLTDQFSPANLLRY
jgi:spermidine synthase